MALFRSPLGMNARRCLRSTSSLLLILSAAACAPSSPEADAAAGSTGGSGGNSSGVRDGGEATSSRDSEAPPDATESVGDSGAADAFAPPDANPTSEDAGGNPADASTDAGPEAEADSGTGSDSGTTADASNVDDGGPGDAEARACTYDTECGTEQWCRGGRCATSRYCLLDDDCAAGDQCDPFRQLCTGCRRDADCGEFERCVDQEECVGFDGCEDSLDCEAGMVCQTSRGECVRCTGDEDCDEGSICIHNECHLECDSDLDCTPQGLLCRRDYFFQPDRCVECLQHDDCDPDEHCVDGACQPDVCTAGEQRCAGSWVCTNSSFIQVNCRDVSSPACEECLADPSSFSSGWQSIQVCNSVGDGFEWLSNCTPPPTYGDSCFQSSGAASCMPRVCLPSSATCVDPTTGVRCSADGVTEVTEHCTDGDVCAYGECRPPLCEPESRRCADGVAEVCDVTGTELHRQQCSTLEYCSTGSVRCLGNQEHVALNMYDTPTDYQETVVPTAFGNVFDVTDERILGDVTFDYWIPSGTGGGTPTDGGVPCCSDFAVTFFVHRDNGDGTYARVFQQATTASAACTSTYCSIDGLALRLDAGERYLIGMHVATNFSNYGPTMAAGPLGPQTDLGFVRGRFFVAMAEPPGANMAEPTFDESLAFAMIYTDERP